MEYSALCDHLHSDKPPASNRTFSVKDYHNVLKERLTLLQRLSFRRPLEHVRSSLLPDEGVIDVLSGQLDGRDALILLTTHSLRFTLSGEAGSFAISGRNITLLGNTPHGIRIDHVDPKTAKSLPPHFISKFPHREGAFFVVETDSIAVPKLWGKLDEIDRVLERLLNLAKQFANRNRFGVESSFPQSSDELPLGTVDAIKGEILEGQALCRMLLREVCFEKDSQLLKLVDEVFAADDARRQPAGTRARLFMVWCLCDAMLSVAARRPDAKAMIKVFTSVVREHLDWATPEILPELTSGQARAKVWENFERLNRAFEHPQWQHELQQAAINFIFTTQRDVNAELRVLLTTMPLDIYDKAKLFWEAH
jgi:hypothetical protein